MMKEIGTISKDFKVTDENCINFFDIFRSIFDIEFSQRLLNELDYTYEHYQEFIKQYELISKKRRKRFDDAMYFNEILFLHSMEASSRSKRNLLIHSLVDENVHKNSISYICERILKYGYIKIPNIKRLHTILMDGIDFGEHCNKSFRVNDHYFVGYYKNKEQIHVQYFPPRAKDIEEAVRLILAYLNDYELNQHNPNTYLESDTRDFDKKYALFIQPLIVQALFVILQAFNDGNSRVSRVISSASILNHTNQIFNKNYQLPLLHLSRGYYGFCEQYRLLLKNIALDYSSENWNEWLIFSLHALQSYIDICNQSIQSNHLIDNHVHIKKNSK